MGGNTFIAMVIIFLLIGIYIITHPSVPSKSTFIDTNIMGGLVSAAGPSRYDFTTEIYDRPVVPNLPPLNLNPVGYY